MSSARRSIVISVPVHTLNLDSRFQFKQRLGELLAMLQNYGMGFTR